MNALEDSLFMIERIKDTFQRMQGERQGPTTMINLKTASVSTLHMATKHCDILPHGAPSHGITPPSPLNPLAALAVYIDVNFSAALRMLRTAASAAVEEAKAAVFFGSKGRLKISSFLHGKLQQLWLQAYKGSMQGHIQQLEHTCVIGLQHHNEVAKRSTSKAAGIISNMPSTIHHREELSSRDIDKESPNPACEQSAKRLSPTSRHNRNLSILQQLPASWRPLRRDDGTFVAPPVQLLAAYANDGSNHVPSVFRHGFGPKEQELPAAGGKAAPQQAFECVVGLCVRSLLDLYIQAVRSLQPELLPEGSVILVGAVNVPMMFRVMEEHRLIVQPLDLDPHTLMPTPQSLKQAMRCWGSKAKALVHSHLYGGLCDLQLLVNFSAEHKLLLIEDCAESFVGELYRGHPLADISLFSFGLMKTCTAAGGGIATIETCKVRSRFVAARMRSLQALYPFSSRWTFFKKLCVTIGACGLQNEFIMKTFLRLCYLLQWNPGTFLQSFVRGFPSTGELFKLLRVQPSASLLAVLLERLESWNLEEFVEQQLSTLWFASRLQHLGFRIPGSGASFKTFWLFPIVVPEGETSSELEAVLLKHGLFTASDTTTLVCYNVKPNAAESVGFPTAAAELMQRIVYLPVNRTSTRRQLLQIEAALAKAYGCKPNMHICIKQNDLSI